MTTATAQQFRNPPLPRLEQRRSLGHMTAVTHTLELQAREAPEFIDLTARVAEFVDSSGVREGTLTVHSLHTTAAIVINEREPLLLERDVPAFLERLASPQAHYHHDDLTIRSVNLVPDEPANGHAHLQHLLLGGARVVPVTEGMLALGSWQRILFLELDGVRPRRVLLQLIGLA